MKSLHGIALLSLLIATPVQARSAFDGTWKEDVHSMRESTKPFVYLLKNGMWSCMSCVPAIKVKADATDQPVKGSPYFDTVAITIVDDHVMRELYKKNGKEVTAFTRSVSADGKTVTFEATDYSSPNSAPVTGRGTRTRVGKAPANAHAISGSWQAAGWSDMSESGTAFTLKVDADMLTMTTPTGQKYTAKLDGTDAPYEGDPGVTAVSVKKIKNGELEETDKRGGKVVGVARMTVSADGKSMNIVDDDKEHGRTTSFTSRKQ